MNPLESTEAHDRSVNIVSLLYIHLHDLVAIHLSPILHLYPEDSVRESCPSVLELAEAESVTEWEERLALEITVGMAWHIVIAEIRKIGI